VTVPAFLTDAEKYQLEIGRSQTAEMLKLPVDPNDKVFTSANWIGKGDCLLHPVPAGELTPLQKLRLAEPNFYHDLAVKRGLIKP
jgi:hypothetical protein